MKPWLPSHGRVPCRVRKRPCWAEPVSQFAQKVFVDGADKKRARHEAGHQTGSPAAAHGNSAKIASSKRGGARIRALEKKTGCLGRPVRVLGLSYPPRSALGLQG